MIRSALIIGCCAGSAAAAGLDDCAYELGHHRGGEHKDVGGGIVSYEQSFLEPHSGVTQHVVEGCRSGQRLITIMQQIKDGNAIDRRTEVRAAFAVVSASEAAFDFSDIKARMEQIGAKSDLTRWNKQSCACAQAYPELRLGKDAYEAPPQG